MKTFSDLYVVYTVLSNDDGTFTPYVWSRTSPHYPFRCGFIEFDPSSIFTFSKRSANKLVVRLESTLAYDHDLFTYPLMVLPLAHFCAKFHYDFPTVID